MKKGLGSDIKRVGYSLRLVGAMEGEGAKGRPALSSLVRDDVL